MDAERFFASIRTALFGGSLSQSAVKGVNAILAAWGIYGDGDVRKLAYILATALHECDRFRTMEEYASGKAYEGRKDLGNTVAGDGVKFKGRGFVQLTGRRNYADWSRRLGIDLLKEPQRVCERPIAAHILVEGMMLGTFTGKALPDYVNHRSCDYRSARRTVNGTDKASLIAGYAEKFETALIDAGYLKDTPEAPPKPTSAPRPAPAPSPAPKAKPEPLAEPWGTGAKIWATAAALTLIGIVALFFYGGN